MSTGTVLIIDDEADLRQLLAHVLELEDYHVLQAPDARRGLEILKQHADDILVVLSDVKLPDGHGVELLPRYKAAAPLAEVVLLTAYARIADSVQAMKQGAFDYLAKGEADEQIAVVVARAADKAQLQRRVADLERQAGVQHSFESMIGTSAALRQAQELARQAAPTDSTILLEGPTGAGKELFAQAIHQASRRQLKPFVAVNCSAFPRDLLESELFGYKKGAFTGANVDKKGLLSEAHGGTLFLDEIGELELNVQAKLLRVLETQTFIRLGDTKPTQVNVRIVAATNRNLKQEAEAGHFRPDLYYRLSVFTVRVPALKERAADIEPLTLHFLHYFAAKLRKRLPGIEPEALELLRRHDWPGNVRELKNVLERATILTPDAHLLSRYALPSELLESTEAGSPDSDPADLSLRAAEARHIRRVFAEVGGNKTEAARQLRISLATLYRKLQEYGISG